MKMTGAARPYRAAAGGMMGSASGDAQDQVLAARFDVLSKGSDRGRMLARCE